MGVDPDNDWVAEYEVIPGKEKVVKELQQLAKKADEIYLATDLDREGEAIAWHLAEILGGDPSRYRRVTFNEITKKAIQEAFKAPSQVNQDRVDAQQARRFLDRVVGFMVSPLLWSKVAKGLSAGRVQSVAVRLVVEREREIRAFVPDEYWDLHADLAGQAGSAEFQATKDGGKAIKMRNQGKPMPWWAEYSLPGHCVLQIAKTNQHKPNPVRRSLRRHCSKLRVHDWALA